MSATVFDWGAIQSGKPTTLAGYGITDAALKLAEVAITDAAVAMLSNRRYVGSIADFTVDRNYTLPAGTAGDIIEVHVLTGDDAYELILLGASGVTINGGVAATEWSRLFIDNEIVRFRCHAENDWRVEADGRQKSNGTLYRTASSTGTELVSGSYTTVPFTDSENVQGVVASTVDSDITVRRAGMYQISCTSHVLLVTGNVFSAINAAGSRKSYDSKIIAVSDNFVSSGVRIMLLAAGAVANAEVYHSSGVGRNVGQNSQITVRELL